MIRLTSIIIICGLIGLQFWAPEKPPIPIEELTIIEALNQLGDVTLDGQLADRSVKGVSVEAGKSFVLNGYGIKPNGNKTSRISRHFECTACHNIEREDPDLTSIDPQARLSYVIDKGIPFLQGTTLYGLINRTSFYNGDYEKKYGDLVEKARNNVREAIQLCATECSQGRKLKKWELESILAFMETIQIKIADLDLNTDEVQLIRSAIEEGSPSSEAVDLIKSKYMAYSPAHFIDPPPNRKEGNGLKGNPENGKKIYKNSCLHCHKNQRYSFFRLDDSPLTIKHLAHHFEKYTRHSVYQVGRYGTSPLTLKKAYMPQYTEEKMSRQQMEDLRSYLTFKANG
jgi:mono/diheme cytochrome c family protein